MNVIPLGNLDDCPDVCATENGWLVAGVTVLIVNGHEERQPGQLMWFDRDGNLTATEEFYTGTKDGGASPRLAPAGPYIWLAQRALTDGILQATLRRLEGLAVAATTVHGRADGTLALNGDWLAFQDSPAGVVRGLPLLLPLGPSVILRNETRPTGLSRMDGTWPKFVDEDRDSVPGMTNPVSRYRIVVGEAPDGGIAVRTGVGKPQGTLLPGEFTNTPRGAAQWNEDAFAAVCWGGTGAKLVLFTTADLIQ